MIDAEKLERTILDQQISIQVGGKATRTRMPYEPQTMSQNGFVPIHTFLSSDKMSLLLYANYR